MVCHFCFVVVLYVAFVGDSVILVPLAQIYPIIHYFKLEEKYGDASLC